MMRSLKLPILAFLLAVAGFVAYWIVLGDSGVKPVTNTNPPRPTTRQAVDRDIGIGSGKRPWIQQVDATGTRLIREFRAAEYSPQKDGSLICVEPEAKFYLADGQELRLNGERGKVNIDKDTGGGNVGSFAGPSQPPNRGQLFGVVLTLYDRSSPDPVITMTLNNVVFDTDTLEIRTEGYTDPATGQHIAADQVPVVMRGEYEFDGQGLIVRWNDRDHQLQLLQVMHGGRMLIRHPSKFNKSLMRSNSPGPSSAVPLPVMLASNDPQSAADAIAPLAATTAPSTAPVGVMYHAQFRDVVRIQQADDVTISADVMHVKFTPSRDRRNAASTQPTTTPAKDQTATTQTALAATTAPTDAANAATAVDPAKAEEKPIVVTWSGPMILTPESNSAIAPLPAGEAIVNLRGTPVVMQREGGEARARELNYQTLGKRIELRADGELPTVTFKDSRGATVEGERVDVSVDGGEMIVEGKSQATVPMDQAGQFVTAHWTRRGQLHFLKSSDANKPNIDLVRLSGDVQVDHPQVQASAQNLEMDFSKPAAGEKPTLEQIRAWDDVSCAIKKDQKLESRISAQRVELQTTVGADKKVLVSALSARGNVRASNEDRDLSAEKLDMTLSPSADATKSTVQSLHAQQNVLITMKDASTAKCDDLQLSGSKQELKIDMTSRDRATLSDKDGNILTGRAIHYVAKTQQASIDGAGSLRMMRQDVKGAKQMPIDLTWTGGMNMDGAANRIVIKDNVIANTADAVDSRQTVNAQLLQVELEETATTQPANVASDSQGIAFSTRRPKQITFEKAVSAELVKLRETEVLQKVNVVTEKLVVDPQTRKLSVPGPGKMLIEGDEKPPEKPGDPKGLTAIAWSDHMTIDQEQSVFEIVGEVRIAHTNPGDKDAVGISAAKATIALEEAGERPTPQSISFAGPVRLTSGTVVFDCSSLDVDLATGRSVGKGTMEHPVQFTDEKGSAECSEIIFNSKTRQVESMKEPHATVKK